jgi:hypothetical protein
LDIDPTTGIIYASTGNGNAYNQKGHLFILNKDGTLTHVGATGQVEVEALSFDPGGQLWGWVSGKGLFKINKATAAITLVKSSSKDIEGMAWNNDGTRLYLSSQRNLFVYNPSTKTISLVTQSLPGVVEALDMRPDNLLALGVHKSPTFTLYAYDPLAKAVVASENINVAPYYDVEGISWCVTPAEVAPTVALVKSATPTTLPEPGGDFNFTLEITNTSNESVKITALTDTQSAAATGFSSCTDLVGNTLAAGASTSCTYTVTHTAAGSYPNTASVMVEDNEQHPASDTDDETVTVTAGPTPQLCTSYAVHDYEVVNSQFLILDPSNTPALIPLGPLYPKADFEGLDVDPTTGIIYATTGNGNAYSQKGHLFILNGQDGTLTHVGATGRREVEALAFDPNGQLWGWVSGKGLFKIDKATGASTLVKSDSKDIEGMAWNAAGNLLYLASRRNLYTYNPSTKAITLLAQNLPGVVEGLEMRPDGLLALGVHGANILYAYDPGTKSVVAAENISIDPYYDVESLHWCFPEE